MNNEVLELLFDKYIRQAYLVLRDDYSDRCLSKEEAQILQGMLETRLGIPDPEGEFPEEGWQRSSWCAGG